MPAKSTDATPAVIDGSQHFLAISLPSREHPSYGAILDLLKRHGFILEPSNRKWWLRDRHRTLGFLAAHEARFRDEFGAQFTDNFRKNAALIGRVEAVTDVQETGGDFSVTLGLRAGSADERAVRDALAANRGYVEADGRVYLLDPGQVARVEAAQRALGGGASGAGRRTHRIGPARLAEVEALLESVSPSFAPPAAWKRRSAALRNLSVLEPAPLPPGLASELRPYQQIGAAWLWHLRQLDLGGILADEMGLGKTVQALAFLASGPGRKLQSSLVVAPASLLENWRRESARWVPSLRVFVHHGANRIEGEAGFAAFDLIITSYGTLTRDRGLFSGFEFENAIADEAQHIKNRRSQNAAALRSIRARGRFLLTGTPLENSLDDLRSLFEFILPGYLGRPPEGSSPRDRSWFDERTRAQVAPYMLRRTKAAVAADLPPRIEQTLWCELSPAQASLYRETRERSERDLIDLQASGAGEGRLRFAALTQLLRLRQICCDPRLVQSEAESGKLQAFRELLAEAVDDGHRLLVFSQFTSLLALLRRELDEQGVAYAYLDGSMPAAARQEQVDGFQSGSAPVFLLSLKAGGTGLNLTAADLVVHFDPWWNPAVEAQATDRAHRLGQRRTVTSYKLIAAGTVEERVMALQEEKKRLIADVFEASDEAASKLSLGELRGLLGPAD